MFRSLRTRAMRPVAVTVACALALPAGASGAGNSPLHVDPASPVAKAYALPLDGVRGAASGAGPTATLFGAGIKRSTGHVSQGTVPAAAGTRVHRSHTRLGRPGARRPGARRRGTGHQGTGRRIRGGAIPAAYRILEPGSSSGLVWMAIAAAVLLALGGAGALLLRRRR